MSTEDLERYEAEIELQLYKEYRDIAPMFRYVVETERRFYLANSVTRTVHDADGRSWVELELADAWVWDMYRQSRFVPSVRVVTFRDVNIEELRRVRSSGPSGGTPVTEARRALGLAGEDAAAAWYVAGGYEVVARNWRCRLGELDLVVRLGRTVVFCEVKTRSSAAFGLPVEAITAAKRTRLRHLAARFLDESGVRAGEIRFDVVSVLAGEIEVLHGAF